MSVIVAGLLSCMYRFCVVMPPTLKKLEGHIAFGLSVCVCGGGGGWVSGCVC